MRRSWRGVLGAVALVCLAIVLNPARPARPATPASLDSYPAVYEQLEIEHQIAADGSLVEIRRARVRIQSATGAAWFARITVPVRSREAEVRMVSAGVRQPGGAERRLDIARLEEAAPDTARFRVFNVPGVLAGDEIVSEARVRYRAPAERQWWLNLAPAFDLPVRSGKWTVTMPNGIGLGTDVWRDQGHTETQPGVHVWQLANAAVEESPKPWFGVSTFATWNEVGDWLRSRQPAAPDATIRAEARRLTAGKARPAAVEALYARVAQGVRSLDRPLADSGYRGRAPAQTLAEGAGDAVSKHVLLAALLASETAQCFAVFVNASGTLDIDFPSPGQLDSVVSLVQDGGTWLDASLEVARAGAFLPDMRGRRGLLIGTRGSEIVQVPEAPPGFNRVRAVWSGTLDAKGDVDAALRVEVRGDFEAVLRRAFRDGGAEADALLRRLLMEPFGTQAASHSEIFDLRGPLVVEVHASIPQFVQPLTRRAGAHFQAVNFAQDCHCGPAPKDPPVQQDPPALQPPYTVEEVFELKLPEGVRPILPPSVNKSGVAGAIRSSAEFAGGVLRVQRTVEMRSDDSPDALRFAASLMFDLARNQVFEHTGTIDVDALLKDRSNSDLDSAGYEAVDRDPELARVILEFATRKNPQSRYSWNNLGRTYEALGRREDAMKAYDRQIAVNPKDEWSYAGRGLLLSRMKRDREAIPWFERQLQIVPESDFALRNMGHSYLELGRWPDAEAVLKRALAAAPEDSDVLVDLGQALACQGDLAGGKEHFAHAIRVCPPAANNVAQALATCGVGLDYARDQAEGALKTTQVVFDATRGLAEWAEGAGAQWIIASNLDALGKVLFRANRAAEAARLLDAAGAMGADEGLSLDIRDVQIALGNLRAAAQAHADAQQLAGDRKLEVPPGIAPLLSQAIPAVDADGWRRIAIRPRSGDAPHSFGADRQVVLACTVSAAGATEECTVLEGGAALQSAALRDAALLAFPRVNWRGTPEKITRLIRLAYPPDGRVEAFEAASAAARAQVRRLMPFTKPAEAGTAN